MGEDALITRQQLLESCLLLTRSEGSQIASGLDAFAANVPSSNVPLL